MQVGVQVFQVVLARNTPLAQFNGESVTIQLRHARSQAQRQPAIGVKAARQLNLHKSLALAGPQRQAGKDLFIEFQNDAHARSIPSGLREVNQ